jgi:beta-phosphoglucomutase-like phosphatase (HAD superfamily)
MSSDLRPEIQGVALDFDGVLANTVAAHTAARRDALTQLDYEVDEGIQIEAHRHGSHPEEIIGWVLQQIGVMPPDADVLQDPLVAEVVSLKSSLYFAHAARGLEAIPGSVDYVRRAFEAYGGRVVIATTAMREFEVVPFLRKYDIEDKIKDIVSKEDTPLGRMKPDPFVYDRAVDLLGVPAAHVMAIEDSPRGLESAKRARGGVLYAIALTTTHRADDLRNADYVLGSFAQILVP